MISQGLQVIHVVGGIVEERYFSMQNKLESSSYRVTKIKIVIFQRSASFCNKCNGKCRKSMDKTTNIKRQTQVEFTMEKSSNRLSKAGKLKKGYKKLVEVLSVIGSVLQIVDGAIAIYR